MEAGTVSAAEASTGSQTIADIVKLAAERAPDGTALKHKVGDEWRDVSYAQLGEAVKEIALGLVDLGIEKGERVSILSHTRPEWTFANFGILASGAASVSIYQTNSPEEVHYVADHSESTAIFAEDAEQLEKIRKIRGDLPHLEHVIAFESDGQDDHISLDDLRERGRQRSDEEYAERIANVTPDDVCLYIYTSGTTGPPKGCILTHGNYRRVIDMTQEMGILGDDELVYLFLPLAHAFAVLIQFGAIDLGSTIAYWEKDPQKIVPNLMEVKPTYFPSVPRIFEKIYQLATSNAGDPEKLKQAVQLGLKVRLAQQRGEEVPAELMAAFEQADEQLYQNVRNIFGGRIRQCVTGAAPIAPEILEFFFACGVPVMEGYGMTETSTVATGQTPEECRFGSIGKPLPGVEVKIAEDGEILLRGDNIFQGYYKNDDASREALEGGWLHTGDLGRIDDDGFVYISGRKKDIIITAGGKNVTPANLENGIKQNQYVSQCVVVGDRRPYLVALVTLDPEVAAEETPEIRESIQKTVDEVNSKVGPVEQIKYFKILPSDLSQETGELTPTMKVKRNVVHEKFAADIDALYEQGQARQAG
ncbi:MAG TPA: AMP-dependent synthetase/ligase [Thermoleophilaceae bacterium]|nr:AMP-dependent synthetase/ligase [Thermoleophilaceae bacterium]